MRLCCRQNRILLQIIQGQGEQCYFGIAFQRVKTHGLGEVRSTVGATPVLQGETAQNTDGEEENGAQETEASEVILEKSHSASGAGAYSYDGRSDDDGLGGSIRGYKTGGGHRVVGLVVWGLLLIWGRGTTECLVHTWN